MKSPQLILLSGLLLTSGVLAQTQQAYLKVSPLANVNFGMRSATSVAIDGNIAVVGSPFEASAATGVNISSPAFNGSSGAACVYERIGSTWTLTAYLKPLNTGANDEFGRSVAISGNTILIGAPAEDSNPAGGMNDDTLSNSGAAYVFTRDPVTHAWTQQAMIKASNAGIGDAFGTTVAISGDTLAVGAALEDGSATGPDTETSPSNSGAVYVFARSSAAWTQQARLKAGNADVDDNFGASLSLSGDTLVAGAYQEDSSAATIGGDGADNSFSNAGAAYVYFRTGSTWAQQAYLKAPNVQAQDNFGWAVSISGDTIAVGAPSEAGGGSGAIPGDSAAAQMGNNSLPYAGAAYIFQRSGAAWAFHTYVKSSNRDSYDNFGSAVAMDGDTLIVGSPEEDGLVPGLSGVLTLPGATDSSSSRNSGSAERFARSGGVWGPSSYFFKSSTIGDGDKFGAAVSISGGTVIVGAPFEDSNARGVGGDQANNAGNDNGAAYVFAGFAPPTPDLIIEQTAGTPLVNGATAVNLGLALTSGDAARIFTVRNDGDGALESVTFSVSGPAAADFTVDRAALPASLQPGNTGAFTVNFRPTTTGTKTATLQITSNDPVKSPFVIALNGLGVTVDGASGSGSGGETATPFRIRQTAYVKASNTDATAPEAGLGNVPDSLGTSVAISGDLMVIGAPGEDSAVFAVINSGVADALQENNTLIDAGAAYVFRRNAATGAWSQEAYLKPSNPGAEDAFGSSVAVDGNTIVVGAPDEDGSSPGIDGPVNEGMGDAGAAYVFSRDTVTGLWSQQAYLKSAAPVEYASLSFGSAVAISGQTVLIGESETTAPGAETYFGVVSVFFRTGTIWTAQARLVDPTPAPSEYEFGTSLAISGSTAVIAKPSSRRFERGHAYVYTRVGSAWSLITELRASNSADGRYGTAVAVAGQTVVVGSPYDDVNGGIYQGAAYIYEPGGPEGWQLMARLTPTNGFAAWDRDDLNRGILFGSAVALTANTVLVGARFESSDAVGINGFAFNAQRHESGAVYEYERSGDTWTQKGYLKASNPDRYDGFGGAIAISGNTAVVAAPYESSSARGIGGNQLDNSSTNAGAAYVFTGLAPEADLKVTRNGGSELASGTTVNCGVVPSGSTRSMTFDVTNVGDRDLVFSVNDDPAVVRILPFLTGGGVNFSRGAITGNVGDVLPPAASGTVTVNFQPSAPGDWSTVLRITTTDPDEGSYTLTLTGHCPTATEDSDADGVLDAAEFFLEPAGFLVGQNDSDRVANLQTNSQSLGLYDIAGLQTLTPNPLIITRDPATGLFTLKAGFSKSTTLNSFDPFPMTPSGATINAAGELEYQFSSPDPRAFFRLERR